MTSGMATERFREAYRRHAYALPPFLPDFPFPAAYRGAYAERRKICGLQLYDACGIQREDRAGSRRQMLENFSFFGAPHVAVVTTEQDLGVYGAIDCGGYVSNFLLAARSVGVATIPQAAIAAYAPFVRDYFGFPENRRVLCGISFGYADSEHPVNRFRTGRVGIEDAVRWLEE